MTHWLVTGGAGYIGAHVAQAMLDSGREVSVIDDLSSGHRAFVPERARFIEGSLLERSVLSHAFDAEVDGVVHLAGFKYAGESIRYPTHTYRQNVGAMVELLDAMRHAGVGKLVFSSSAGVYGTPSVDRVTESTPTAPESPYGETKLVGEWLMHGERRRTDVARRFEGVALRYFNVIGSGLPHVLDMSPHNLVPRVVATIDRGERPQINGDDYDTPDGTCIRDYVHVADVALAHATAAARLEEGALLEPVYNLGSGVGTSVRELMRAITTAAGLDIEPVIAPRRPGDPARIVADGTLARRDLDWHMRRSLDDMVASAWRTAHRD